MADKNDLDLRCLVDENLNSTYQEGYKKARKLTQARYRAMLTMMKEQLQAKDRIE